MTGQNNITRREAIKTAARYVALGGLVLGVGLVVGREGCRKSGKCGGCGQNASCELPEARKWREGRG